MIPMLHRIATFAISPIKSRMIPNVIMFPDWTSMAVPADGSYGVADGIIYSYPVTCQNGDYQIVQGLTIDDFSRQRMQATEAELREERDGVKDLLGT